MFQKLLVLLLLIYANGKSAKSINGYEDIDQNDELAAIKSDLNDFSDLTVKLERPPTAPNLNQNIENTNGSLMIIMVAIGVLLKGRHCTVVNNLLSAISVPSNIRQTR
ncbi:uncharacterized protein LOC124819249 isoform X1 [Hydra vulgaris]|uniref:uncharacterized protein LOC124819249 isoform X1 n=1 Tax=Hydra vulgaris TaxID=6087 RepID=UPI001F5FBCD8|nr:uncharacterized protein LOC124819249 isoform X2 [Hydra vulgaris]